ncbi:MAG: TolC family outer membrane protein [Rhodanobacter sp.]
MRLKLLTLALTMAAISLPSHGEDLVDAYRQARANDPVLAQADATNLATREGVPQARAQLLPQISASLGLTQSSNASSASNGSSASGSDYLCNGLSAGTGTYNCSAFSDSSLGSGGSVGHERSRALSGQLNQVVFDWSKFANLQAAHSTSNASQQTYEAASQDLYVRVATAYFGILTSQDALTFATANEEAYKKQYDQASEQYKVGIAAITGAYQAKAAYEAARAQTVAAQNTLNDAREALTQITGKPVGELKKLRPDLPLDPPSPNDPNAWVQDALKNNPTVLSQKFSVEAAEHDITVARSGHLPTIGATVSRGKTTSWLENGSATNFSGNGRFGTTIGLTLTVPIFSGGAVQSQVRQSIDQRDAAQDSLESQRRLIVRSTLNYYRSILADIEQVQSGQAAVESGQKALDATRAGFNVGTQTMIDVLNAIQTLTSAESTYSQARHQMVLDKLNLKYSVGTIDFKDLETANALLQ